MSPDARLEDARKVLQRAREKRDVVFQVKNLESRRGVAGQVIGPGVLGGSDVVYSCVYYLNISGHPAEATELLDTYYKLRQVAGLPEVPRTSRVSRDPNALGVHCRFPGLGTSRGFRKVGRRGRRR